LFERNRRTALIEGVMAGILFGTAAIFIRFLSALNVSSIAFWRLVIASATLGVILFLLKQRFKFDEVRANAKHILLLGALIGLHFVLFISAVRNTTILNATVLVNTSPIFSVLISSFLFNVKPSKLAVIGLITSFLGICLITYGDAFYALTIGLIGDLEAVLASLAEGFYLNYGRNLRVKLPLLSMVIPIYLVAAVFVGAFSTLSGVSLALPNQLYLIAGLIGLGILPTALGHTFYFSSLSNLKSFETATLALLEPIGATLLGIVIFGEIPLMGFVFGAFLVLSGVVLVVGKGE